MHIYGIGLPRTGTHSLSQALVDLGFSSSHSCILEDTTEGVSHDDCMAIVDNGFYKNYQALISEDSRFILTTRAEKPWKESVEQFERTPEDIPDIKKYEREVRGFCKQHNHPLLVLNVFTMKNSARLLCDFLQVPKKDYTFPHVTTALPSRWVSNFPWLT